jgi:hypothetical protein
VVTRKLTGKGISKHEADHWNDFADLIILELEVAGPTNKRDFVSSGVPNEVLRRQFLASRQQLPPLIFQNKNRHGWKSR